MKLNDKFTFGKFKGQTLKSVMANKGSYVGWCLDNIPGFHIEPNDVEKAFVAQYDKWKENHIGTTVCYALPLGAKSMMRHMVDKLETNNEDMLCAYEEE